jgi:hypothetical protein
MKAALTLTLAAAMVSHAFADDKADILARYNDIGSALKAKSTSKFFEVLSKDCSWKDTAGRTSNRAQIEKEVTAQFGIPLKVNSYNVKINSFTKVANGYMVNSTITMTGVVTNPRVIQKKSSSNSPQKEKKIFSVNTSNDLWVKENGKWVVKTITGVSQDLRVDNSGLIPAQLSPIQKQP